MREHKVVIVATVKYDDTKWCAEDTKRNLPDWVASALARDEGGTPTNPCPYWLEDPTVYVSLGDFDADRREGLDHFEGTEPVVGKPLPGKPDTCIVRGVATMPDAEGKPQAWVVAVEIMDTVRRSLHPLIVWTVYRGANGLEAAHGEYCDGVVPWAEGFWARADKHDCYFTSQPHAALLALDPKRKVVVG